MLQFIDRFAGFVEHRSRRLLPKTLVSFLFVGSVGVVVHLLVLNILLHVVTHDFRYANGSAMLAAATFNYLLNNKATFAALTLAGKRIVVGYVIYLLIASVGLAASLFLSTAIFNRSGHPTFAALCGIVVGALWNYFMSYTFVWKLLSRVLRDKK